MNLFYEEVYKIPHISSKLIRSHPDVPKDIKWFFIFMLVHGGHFLYFLLFVYDIIYHNLKAGDLAQTCKNLTLCVTGIYVGFQYGVLLYKKKRLVSLIESVKKDYIKVKTLPLEDQETVLKYAKKTILVGRSWFTIAFIGNFRWIPIHEFTFPKYIDEQKDHPLMFTVLYVTSLFYIAYCGCVYCAFSPLGPNFMLHACGKMEILIKRVEQLSFENHSAQDNCKELKLIAEELQIIYNFVDEIKESFKFSYEVFLKFTSLIVPVTLYAIIEAFVAGDICVEFIVFIVGAVVISLSPCYYGELLREKGEMFRVAIYCCGWERTWDRPTRTMVLMLLQRSSQPIALRTIFKILCLDTLTDVFRQSYAIFGLMRAMWT